jgi:tetratricopeptide (TPR) repeat protein
MDTARNPLTPEQIQRLLAGLDASPADSACPSDDELQAYVAGALDRDERRAIEAHVDACEPCREDVETWRLEWRAGFAANGEAISELESLRETAAETKRPETRNRDLSSGDGLAARPVAWLDARVLVPALASALLACIGLSAYLAGRLAERTSASDRQIAELQAAAQVRMAMLETIHAIGEWRTAVESGADARAVAASMRRVDLLELPRTAGAPFPLMAVSPVGGNVSTLGASLDHDPVLRSEYDDYLRRLSDMLPSLSDALVETGKIEQARMLLAFLRREQPGVVDNWYGEAEMFKLAGNQRAAIALYEEMIQRGLANGDPRPHHYAGYSSFLLGDFDAARRYYDKALAIAPRYAKVYYNKAVLYRQMPGLGPAERERLYEENWRRAFELTEQAYAAAGESNPRIVFTLAILHAVRPGASNRDRALFLLERAIGGERAYLTRAQQDPAFSAFLEPRNEPHYSRFRELVDRYRSLSAESAALKGPYNPDVFIE